MQPSLPATAHRCCWRTALAACWWPNGRSPAHRCRSPARCWCRPAMSKRPPIPSIRTASHQFRCWRCPSLRWSWQVRTLNMPRWSGRALRRRLGQRDRRGSRCGTPEWRFRVWSVAGRGGVAGRVFRQTKKRGLSKVCAPPSARLINCITAGSLRDSICRLVQMISAP